MFSGRRTAAPLCGLLAREALSQNLAHFSVYRSSALSVDRFLRGGGRTKWKGGIYVPKDKLFDTTPDIRTLVDPTTGWKQLIKRCGVVAVKIGMTSEYSEYYEYMPLTVLQIMDCQVVQVKTENQKEGEVAIQVGADNANLARVPKPQRGHFLRHGVPPKRVLMEFRVDATAQLRPGTELRAEHFVPGQFLDVTGVSIGKGFQGVMKRWGFKGGRASHGNSKTHRQMGSTGQHSNPSRVFPGKKMPGRMGNKRSTIKNLMLWKIDTRLNLLYVKGHIPGSRNKYVRVKDAKNKYQPMVLPFPTYVRKPQEMLPEIITANSPPPSWFRNMEARKVMYAEDPSKNRDDDTSALQLVYKYKEEFPTVEKWRKGLLPPGRNPSQHPSCASAGVTLQIPWLRDIIREVQVADRKRKQQAEEAAEKAKQII